MAWRIGVDIGGTFTDVALVNDTTGAIGIAKTLTTPGDFGQGVVNALKEALKTYDVPADDVSLLSHATTVVTNAILEEKGARTALIATRGFRDILELRRSSRSIGGHGTDRRTGRYRNPIGGRRDRRHCGYDQDARCRRDCRIAVVFLFKRQSREDTRRPLTRRSAGHDSVSLIRSSARNS